MYEEILGGDELNIGRQKINKLLKANIDGIPRAQVPWIEDENFKLKTLINDGIYIIGNNVKDKVTRGISMLIVHVGKTVQSTRQKRIHQQLVSLYYKNNQYSRSFYVDSDGSTILAENSWEKNILNTSNIKDLNESFYSVRVLDNESIDLDTVHEEGRYIITKKITNMPFGNMGLLDVQKFTNGELNANSGFIIQRFNSLDSETKTFLRVIRFSSFTPLTIDYKNSWTSRENNNPWQGKKHVALGTSMTMRPESYSRKVSKILEMNHDNRGVSGGGITSSAESGNTTMKAINRLEDFEGLLTIEIGPNDGEHPIGQLGDTDETTFYGCLYKGLQEAQKRTSARIVVLTMTGSWAEYNNGQHGARKSVLNNWGVESGSMYRFKMRKAIFDTCAMFSIPVIDVQGECGLGGYLLNKQTSVDHIHHSQLGGDIVADFVAKKLITINPFPERLSAGGNE